MDTSPVALARKHNKKKSIESTSSLEREFKNLFKKKEKSPLKKPNKVVEFFKPSKYKRDKVAPSFTRTHTPTAHTFVEPQNEERRHSFSSIYTVQQQVEPQSAINSFSNRLSNAFRGDQIQDHISTHSDITHAHQDSNALTHNSAQTMSAYSSYPRSSYSNMDDPIHVEEKSATPLTYFDSPETHEKIQALLEVLTDTEHVNVDGTETTPHDVYLTMLDRLDSIWAERMVGYELTRA